MTTTTGKKPARARATKRVAEPMVPFVEHYRDLPQRLGNGKHAPILEFDGSYEDIDERRLFVRRTSDWTPDKRQAVFVHGLGGSARNWTDLMYLLEPLVAGIAPDLPGFGRSPVPHDGDYSIPAHSQAVIRLIETACDGPVDLFGNSMGGAIAIRIAALRPDLVRSLILISPAVPNLRPRLSVAPLLAMTAPGIAELGERVMGPPDAIEAVERKYRLCYLDPGKVHPQRRQIEIEETQWRLAQSHASQALRQSARGLGRTFLPGPQNTWTLSEQVTAPTLAVFGTDDKLVDPRMATPTAAHLHNSKVVTLKTGHVAQMEEPQRVAELVLTLWAQMFA